MLSQVCEKVGLKPTQGNKEAIKAFLKKAADIDTLGRMDDDDDLTYNVRLSRFITHSAILLASELGMEIDLPGENNVEEDDMKNFLKAIYHGNTTGQAGQDC
jgi:hypothetical protein